MSTHSKEPWDERTIISPTLHLFYLNISNFLTLSTLRHVTDTRVPSRLLTSPHESTAHRQFTTDSSTASSVTDSIPCRHLVYAAPSKNSKLRLGSHTPKGFIAVSAPPSAPPLGTR